MERHAFEVQFFDFVADFQAPFYVNVKSVGAEVDFSDASAIEIVDFFGDVFWGTLPYPGLFKFPNGVGAVRAVVGATADWQHVCHAFLLAYGDVVVFEVD